MDNKTGKFILSLRQEKGLSQYQLAEMIPISRQAVSKWERGENIPDSYTLLKLSEMFNVTINELLLGERQLDNSVESLEKTTLTILDQSNKKSKKIKRMLIIFTTIITVLLLAFLSYYFISSYNSVEVYTVGGDNNKTFMKSGIFITTKEKYYLKLGELHSNTNKTIKNIQFYYKKNGKEILIQEDKDIDNIVLKEYYGYSEKINYKDIKELLKKSYLKITYEDNTKEILELKFNKNFINDNLFLLKSKKYNKVIKDAEIIDKEVEDKKDDKEEKKETKEEDKKEEIRQEESKVETPKVEETKPVVNQPKEEPTPVEEPITIETIKAKIKENGEYSDGGYYYTKNSGGITINYIYQENLNQIMMFDTAGGSWSYIGAANMYSCATEYDQDLCRNIVLENAREYLFK